MLMNESWYAIHSKNLLLKMIDLNDCNIKYLSIMINGGWATKRASIFIYNIPSTYTGEKCGFINFEELNPTNKKLLGVNNNEILKIALEEAKLICEEDVKFCENIGLNGLKIIEEIYNKKKDIVNILTHCNAGWLATIDWGTATSPIYHAHKKGIKVHVWVDETRPRNQGANLTSYELNEEEIPNTIIADNTGGILMQRGKVDICIVGTDRTIATGDVANKIGTYLKALAAKDNDVPFYVALPSSTIDWETKDFKDIPIEERNSEELSHAEGLDENNNLKKILIYPKKSKAMNLAFDVTPAKYVTGLITEKGVCEASTEGLKKLFK